MILLTADHVRSVLRYDAETGVFTWRQAVPKRPAGSVAGTDKGNGYWMISIGGKQYLAHRLAWLCVHGVWPTAGIDHINGDRADNRIANLRLCSQQQNNGNWRKAHKNNKSGFRGVYFAKAKGKWISTIKADGKTRYLGIYKTAEEAYAAYKVAAVALFGEFYHDSASN